MKLTRQNPDTGEWEKVVETNTPQARTVDPVNGFTFECRGSCGDTQLYQVHLLEHELKWMAYTYKTGWRDPDFPPK